MQGMLIMTKKYQANLERIVQIVLSQPDGLSIEELLTLMTNAIPKRTLQYHLSHLVKAGTIERKGSGRSSRYYASKTDEKSRLVESIIPLSEESKQTQKLLSVPLQLRTHVSYRYEFLDAYEPNRTFYLSSQIVEKLSKLGAGVEKGRPAGTYAKKIYQRLLIDLSWNSSRLEGNTYSMLETERLFAAGEEAPGKDPIETQMILNHKEAIEFIVSMAEEIDINRYTILNIHGLLSHNLLLDPKACGRLRTNPVKIGFSNYHPIEVPQLIEDYFGTIIQKATLIRNPFEQSFFLMVHLPYLQPFLDVNKRVSRLAGNIPLIRENLHPLSFVDVPEADYIQGLLAIYEFNRIDLFRDVFVWAYERSASLYLATLEAIGRPDPFKVHYRELIYQLIGEIIQQKMNPSTCAQHITAFTQKNVPGEDQKHFTEVIETEINSLHEGNFARFRIRPSIFFEWQRIWNKKN